MADQRNSDGTFPSGVTGNPKGRPPRQAEERLVRRISALLLNGEFDKIIFKGIERAQKGDVAWARLLLEYTVGKPKQPVSGDGDSEIVFRVLYGKDK